MYRGRFLVGEVFRLNNRSRSNPRVEERLSLTDLSNIDKAKIKLKFENARALEQRCEEAATVEMNRSQAEYEQQQLVRRYQKELNSALQNGRYKFGCTMHAHFRFTYPVR